MATLLQLDVGRARRRLFLAPSSLVSPTRNPSALNPPSSQSPRNLILMFLEEIFFESSQNPQHDVPTVVMVSIPSYKGPTNWQTDDRIPIVPIVPSVAQWESGGKKCS